MSEYSEALNELVDMGVKPAETETVQLTTDELIINEMERLTGRKFSDEQRACLMHHGSETILACAGSGKTTALTNMLAKRIWNREITDTSRIICTTYSKAGAEEMNERLRELLNTLNIRCNLEVRTLHSFFYMLMRTFGMGGYKVISNSTRSQYIKEACKDADYICKDDDLMVIDNLISYRVNNLMNDNAAVASPACTLADMSVQQFRDIRVGYDKRKFQNNYIDFDDMQLYLYKWLCKDVDSTDEKTRETGIAVRNYCRAMYNEFYIDEAQDVSKIQYAIIKAIVANPDTGLLDKALMFIGDDDQCIYKWRGAAPEIILTIGTSMNMPNFVLSTNYRCQNEVVDFAHRSIKYNSTRFNKGMNANENGGTVNIQQSISTDLYELSKIAYNKIKELLANGERRSDIAVLCRNNAQLSILNNMLAEKDGIYCSIPEEMKLTKTYIYTDIKNVITLASNRCNGKVTGQTMWKLCDMMTAHMSRQIGAFQDENGLQAIDALKYIGKNVIGMSGDIVEIERELTIDYKSEQKLKYAFARLKQDTREAFKVLLQILTIEDEEKRINQTITKYLTTTEFLYKNTDKNRTLRGIVHYMQDVIRQKGLGDAMRFFRVIEQLEGGDFRPPKDTIRMSTIHGAKGREWKNVILFACDNESMPGFSGLEKMVDNELPQSDIYDSIDEERRLYYVGCTRAKEHLEIITSPHPSVFLMESLGEYAGIDGSTNLEILNTVINGDNVKIISESSVDNKKIEEKMNSVKQGGNTEA